MSRSPVDIAALLALGAALIAAIRAYTARSVVGWIAAGAGALLGIASMIEIGASPRGVIAGASAMFAISELARLMPARSPYPAIGASVFAAALDPSYVGLVAIAGANLVVGPWSRPRWAVLVPIGGALAILVAVIAALAIPALWSTWTGVVPAHRAALDTLALLGDAAGPIVVVAAVAGVISCAMRGPWQSTTIAAVTLGAFAVALRDGTLAPAPFVVTAVATGSAIHRLAATIRIPAGQAIIGAACGFAVLVAPALGLYLR